MLNGYGVTEQEINSYIATLDLDSLKLNLTVANKKEVYQNGVLWYVTNADTTAEKEVQFQLDNTVYSLCCEHFADRRIEYQPQPQYTDTELIMQAFADQELRDLQAQKERQMLAQQQTDIELKLLGVNNNV